MRISLSSIGCRLNTGEIDALSRRFSNLGHLIVSANDDPDIIIFNSCAVTVAAGSESRKIIRGLRKRHPYATLVVTGCYASIDIEKARVLGADLIIGNQYKDDIPNILVETGILHNSNAVEPFTAINSSSSRRTRAFLKVQDGCNNKCTFCVVTIARGKGISKPIDQIVDDINQLISLGFVEIVICGVHLGAYGHDFESRLSLYDMVSMVLNETDIKRLRLSSLEPWDLDPQFFDLWEDDRLLPHLHLPLQSGSDRTLRRMGRRNTANDFRDLVLAARNCIADLAVTTDVIVGFPGETEDDFIDSITFIDQMNFADLHIFSYSGRPGTVASEMPDQIPGNIIKNRMRLMQNVGKRSQDKFVKSFIGRKLDVLWESSSKHDDSLIWSGLTTNYMRAYMHTDFKQNLRNRITTIRMTESYEKGLLGMI